MMDDRIIEFAERVNNGLTLLHHFALGADDKPDEALRLISHALCELGHGVVMAKHDALGNLVVGYCDESFTTDFLPASNKPALSALMRSGPTVICTTADWRENQVLMAILSEGCFLRGMAAVQISANTDVMAGHPGERCRLS